MLGARLPYDSLGAVAAGAVQARIRISQRIGQIAPGDAGDIAEARQARRHAGQGARSTSSVDDFYLTNPIARASAVMAECSALARRRAALTAAE